MMANTIPAPPDLGFFLPSTCRQCPASGCGPVYDRTEDPHTLSWRGGNTPLRCEYRCGVCGCTWTDTWPCRYLLDDADESTP